MFTFPALVLSPFSSRHWKKSAELLEWIGMRLICASNAMVTPTSSVPVSQCAQAAPSIYFNLQNDDPRKTFTFLPAWKTEQLISPGSCVWGWCPMARCLCIARKKHLLVLLPQAMRGCFSHGRWELRHPKDGEVHFGSSQASTRTWRSPCSEWCCPVHQSGTLWWKAVLEQAKPFQLHYHSLQQWAWQWLHRETSKGRESSKRNLVCGSGKSLCRWSKALPLRWATKSFFKRGSCKAQFPKSQLSRPLHFFFPQGFSSQTKSKSLL